MMNISKEKVGIALVPFILCAADAGVTLAFQSGAYWAGSTVYAQEGNAGFKWLLQHSPFYFFAGIIAWMLLFESVVLLVPVSWARFAALAVTMGHTWGLCSWLSSVNYWLCIAAVVAASGIITVGWRTRPAAGPVRAWPIVIPVLGILLAGVAAVWLMQRVYSDRSGPLADRLVECARRGNGWNEAEKALQYMRGRPWREVKTTLSNEGVYELFPLVRAEGYHDFVLRARAGSGLRQDWLIRIEVRNSAIEGIGVDPLLRWYWQEQQ